MAEGYLCLVLHAHLPFVRHPEFEDFLEEDWLFEAVSETYIPLIEMCRRLLEEGVHYRLTLSVTPTLAAMLEDGLLQERYIRHVNRLIDLSEREILRTRWIPSLHRLAVRYHEIYLNAREVFVRGCDKNLLRALRELQDAGALEIITSGATHGFLPLMLGRRNLWRAQILTAVAEHRRHFGRAPQGIWLPECGFDPGLDSVLREDGIRFFFTDTHGILHAEPRPRFGVHAPLLTPNGVAAFGRDVECARQVWCSWLGYPGDYDYREFYRDVGWDLEYEYIRRYLHPDGRRTNLGIKYYRITGPTSDKDVYDFERAHSRAEVHAEHFLQSRIRQMRALRLEMGRPPVVVAPYDAELFGHWWFEGPIWLESLLRRIARTPEIVTIHPSACLDRFRTLQVAMPSFSSWGLRGYAEHWLDASNDWLYPHLHAAGERMVRLANLYRNTGRVDPMEDRILRQAGREFLLAQSSDWAFIMKSGTMTEYATRRSREHIGNFNRLYVALRTGSIDREWLASVENRNNLFPDLDCAVFADPEEPAGRLRPLPALPRPE